MRKVLCAPLLGLFVIVGSLSLATSAQAFTLRNLYLGSCLGVAAGNPNPGGQMVLWKCDGSLNQDFTAVRSYYPSPANSYGEALYTLYNSVAANRVLGVAPVVNGNINAPVVTWTVDYSANQQWTMTPVFTNHDGHQCYAIRSNNQDTMLTPANWNGSIESNYYSYPYGYPGPAYYWPVTNFGKADQGDVVIASAIIWNSATVPPIPEYDWLHYAVQYWCAY